MTKFKPGDQVRVVKLFEDHPSGEWHKQSTTLVMTHTILKIVSQEDKTYLLNIGGAPFDFDIFWESQLEAL